MGLFTVTVGQIAPPCANQEVSIESKTFIDIDGNEEVKLANQEAFGDEEQGSLDKATLEKIKDALTPYVLSS